MRAAIAVLLLAASGVAAGADLPAEFSDPARQQRYQALLGELRCLVCQNQSLSDSNAPLAQDLREEVQKRLQKGESDEEIVDFLVARYGDFVLYRPPFRAQTWLLWLGPFLLLLAAATVVIRVAARRRTEPPPLTPDERARLRELGVEGDPDP